MLCKSTTDPSDSLGWLEFADQGRFLVARAGQPSMIRRWDVGQLRESLRKLGLDWRNVSPSLSSTPGFVNVSVDLGELGNHALPWYRLELAEAKESHALNPNDSVWANRLAWRLLMAPPHDRDDKKAFELSKSVTDREPNISHYLNTYGLALYRIGEYDQAKKVLENNIRLSKDENQLYDLAILILIDKAMNDLNSLKQHQIIYNQILEKHPNLTDFMRRELKCLLDNRN